MTEHRSPIPARVYNAAVGGHVCGPEDVDFGQKVVHIVKYDRAGNEVSFESQITQANKIYVIHDDFTLSSNVTIPANCVLEFDGGSINGNNTIEFQNTVLSGTKSAINTTLNVVGTLKGTIDVDFWKLVDNDATFDNGVALNKIFTIAKYVYIPKKTLYFSTPIVAENIKILTSDATLIYKPSQIGTTAIKLSKATFANIKFNSPLICDGNIDYSESSNSAYIGIDFNSCNNCVLSFIHIKFFNIGLMVSDTNNIGCCYNTINVGTIEQSNYHIRLYQRDYNDNISWVNQNLFIGGRLFNHSTWNSDYPCYKVLAYGAKKEGDEDSYDGIDNITFIGTSVEGSQIPFYIRNGIYNKFINTRQEGNDVQLKLVGNCHHNDFLPGVIIKEYSGDNAILGKVDLSESGYVGLSDASYAFIREVEIGSEYVEIDTSKIKGIKFIGEKSPQSFYIKYLEDENGPISDADRPSYPALYNTTYETGENALSFNGAFVYTSDVYNIPDNIVKVGIKRWNTSVKAYITLYVLNHH